MMADSSPSNSGRIFISYRREESAGHAGRLYDRLFAHFGDRVFMDVHSLKGGVDFEEVIEQVVPSCAVVLAIIGPQWLTSTDEASRRRIDDPHDLMRRELEAAFTAAVRVIPILIAGAAMPKREYLPNGLERLARRHNLRLSNETFHADVDVVMEAIESVVGHQHGDSGTMAPSIMSAGWKDEDSLPRLLQDETLAAEIDDLMRAVAAYPERWADTRCTALLVQDGESSGKATESDYFEAYISYRLTMELRRDRFRILCVTSRRLRDDLAADDQEVFFVYLQAPTVEYPLPTTDSFSVESLIVNDLELLISTEIDAAGSMLVTCDSPALAGLQGQTVTVEMTLRTKIVKQAHAMHLTIPRLSRRVLFAFDFGGTEIQNVDVLDTFLARRKPYIRRMPTMTRARRVEVHSDEWVLPGSGVVFVWR
jgi:hypothetical protein